MSVSLYLTTVSLMGRVYDSERKNYELLDLRVHADDSLRHFLLCMKHTDSMFLLRDRNKFM